MWVFKDKKMMEPFCVFFKDKNDAFCGFLKIKNDEIVWVF